MNAAVDAPTALAYESTEEARLLLGEETVLAEARTAAGEAAYYLSDTIEPDDRVTLLAAAEERRGSAAPEGAELETRATEALALLADVAGEVEDMLRGPSASSELRIALRALRGAIGTIATHFGRGGGTDVKPRPSRRLAGLREVGARHWPPPHR